MGEGVKTGYIGRGAECTCIKVKYEIKAVYNVQKCEEYEAYKMDISVPGAE